MKAPILLQDIRIGSILYYYDGETFDFNRIDWQDLKWLTEKPKDFNECHSGVSLTEEILIQIGFKKISEYEKFAYDKVVYGLDELQLNRVYKYAYDAYVRVSMFNYGPVSFNGRPIKYLHQLQNLYHALTGRWIQINLK